MSDLTTIPASFANVTPSDTEPLSGRVIGLFVGAAGNVTVKGADGVAATFAASAGQYLVGRFRVVMSTGTTASGIVALMEA